MDAGKRFKPVRRKVTFRDYREQRKIHFENQLQKCVWPEVTNAQDVDTATNSLKGIILDLMDECFPVKTVRLSSRDPSGLRLKHLTRKRLRRHCTKTMGKCWSHLLLFLLLSQIIVKTGRPLLQLVPDSGGK